MYVHLHGHSTYSLLEAIGSVKKVVGRVSELGMQAVGIVDYDGMYGAFDVYKTCKSSNIKPLLGVEMPFVLDVSTTRSRHNYGYLCFLAKNYDGYQELLALVSAAHLAKEGEVPYVDLNMIHDHCGSDNLFVFFGGLKSFVGVMLTSGVDENKISEYISLLADHFGVDNLRGEIVAQDYFLVNGLKKVNGFVSKVCSEKGINLFVSSNFHYVSPKDKEAYELALCIKDGKKIYDDDRRKVLGNYHIFSEKELIGVLQKNGFSSNDIDVLIGETEKVASVIDISIPMGVTLFPNYQSPSYIQEKYQVYKDRLVE